MAAEHLCILFVAKTTVLLVLSLQFLAHLSDESYRPVLLLRLVPIKTNLVGFVRCFGIVTDSNRNKKKVERQLQSDDKYHNM